jgi:PAS domain S-box-containing protein
LVQELARLHGGAVRVQSELMQGSTFVVSLPWGKEHLPADRIGAPRTVESTAVSGAAYVQEAMGWLRDDLQVFQEEGGALLPPETPVAVPVAGATVQSRVLLVDDNTDMRDYVRRLLSTFYQVETAADGAAALQAARKRPPDLVLSDIMMPQLDGFGLLDALRSDSRLRHIPVILLSARVGEEARLEGLKSGADDYLVKPFSARELLSRVRWHIAMARTRREAAEREQKLRADAELERERLRQIIDAPPAAIYTTDAEGRVTHFNPAAVEFAGRVPQPGSDRWCVTWKLFYPDGTPLPLEQCPMALALREGRITEGGEFLAERPDGTRVWFTPYPKLVHDSAGRIIGGINMLVDITARKQAEEATGHLAAIVASSDDAIVSKSLDGIIKSWNKSAERVFGYTAKEAIGQHITLIIPPDRWDEETEIISRLRRGERIDHFETVRRRKDGTLVDLSLTISPVCDSSGHVIGASKVARDITQQKRAEERERQITQEAIAANAKFRAVFEQTTVFAGIMSKGGVLMEANRLSLECCGYETKDVLGQPFWDTPWWRQFPESRNKIQAATPRVAAGERYRETLHYSWADGVDRLVDFALYPIVDHKGNVLFLHPTGVDITDIKRAEENYRRLVETLDAEVQARTQELEERNAEVLRQSDMLRTLSWRLLSAQDEERRYIARELHDSAGQTLTVLGINLAHLVQKAGRSAPEVAADAEMIQQTIQQLSREIRTTSYLLHPPLLDESGLASALQWYVQGLCERSDVEIHLSIAHDFGRLRRDMELVIFRLVQEGLTNIHRHSHSKTASIEIVRQPEQVRVEVCDQGKGMSPSRLREIQSGISGVGIRGIRERLRQFSGVLNIESDSSGTRILVAIPLPAPSGQPEQDQREPLQSAV